MNTEKGIIRSVIDTDLYKLSMQMAVVQLFPRSKVRSKFIMRGDTIFPDGFDLELRREVRKMEDLHLTNDEAIFLSNKCKYFTPTYIDFLKSYRFDSSELGITQKDGVLTITIEGYWYKTILWEVPLMALISELYFKMTGEPISDRSEREKNNLDKGRTFYENSVKVADFGTRRRYSYDNQIEVVKDLKSVFTNKNPFLVGTSNVLIAKELDLTPIGTNAHEWYMFHAVEYGYTKANHQALENWTKVYQGDLGIALPDTFTTDVFFRSFNTKFSKLYDGVRQDSDDPYAFTDKAVAHYNSINIDLSSKTIVYSDNLNKTKAVELTKYSKSLGIKSSCGIGTNFSNDVGVKPLNMVIKLSQVLVDGIWIDVVKLSDSETKHTGTEKEIQLCKDTLRIY